MTQTNAKQPATTPATIEDWIEVGATCARGYLQRLGCLFKDHRVHEVADFEQEARLTVWRQFHAGRLRPDDDPRRLQRYVQALARGAVKHYLRDRVKLIAIPAWLSEKEAGFGIPVAFFSSFDNPPEGSCEFLPQLLDRLELEDRIRKVQARVNRSVRCPRSRKLMSDILHGRFDPSRDRQLTDRLRNIQRQVAA